MSSGEVLSGEASTGKVMVDVMTEIMKEVMKVIPGARASIISLGNYYDCGIYLSWYQGRISMNIWANGAVAVNHYNNNDQQTGWDFLSSERESAIALVSGLVKSFKNETASI